VTVATTTVAWLVVVSAAAAVAIARNLERESASEAPVAS